MICLQKTHFKETNRLKMKIQKMIFHANSNQKRAGLFHYYYLLLLLNTNLNFKTDIKGDFPGGPVAKNLPCNVGDVSSIPDLERSCMPAEKLSPCATTRDFVRPRETPHNAVKIPCTPTKTRCSQINK